MAAALAGAWAIRAAPAATDEPTGAPGGSEPAERTERLGPDLAGWAELDLALDVPQGTLEVDTGHFCTLPCRLLLAPGPHTFVLVLPDEDPRTFNLTFEEGRSLRIDSLAAEETPGAFAPETIDADDDSGSAGGAVLYGLGAACILAAVALVSSDVALNVGEGGEDWTLSYAGAGIGVAGLLLAVWGSILGSSGDEAETREPEGEAERPVAPAESVVEF